MIKTVSSYFILELPLVTTKSDERTIIARMEVGRRLFNAVLDETLSRLNKMRSSAEWQAAKDLPFGKSKTEAFKQLNIQFGFREFDLHLFVKSVRKNAGWKDRISAQEAQKITYRVFNSVRDYSFGIKGKPRFKGVNRPLHSLEGSQNTTGIRFKVDSGVVKWNNLILPTYSKDTEYLAEGLKATTKYCRILWKNFNGKKRFFVQLIQEGIAHNRNLLVSKGIEVGVDIGPSTIAIVSEEAVGLEQFAVNVIQPWKKIKKLQRKLDRSRRSCNPNNYNSNGTIKKGKKTWKKSSRYQKHQTKIQETERKLAATRKRDHGQLQNKILAVGNIVKQEKLSFKAFQKLFGRSAKVRASGMFNQGLKRKAESAGGKVIDLDTRTLKMSQYDHITGSYTKKPLSQRYHNLGDGVCCVQRDMYSAFLALNAEEKLHNSNRLNQSWSAVEPLLRRTGLCLDQSASGKAPRFPTVLLPSERIVRRSTFGVGQGVELERV